MTILLFLAVLFVLILVHEWGHFIVAKKTGMRVDEFGIGFPPKLFGIKKGDTLYSLNALPIGGFVRIFGEDGVSSPSSPVDNEVVDRRSEASAEAGEGGAKSAHPEASASDQEGVSDSFTSKSRWAQAAVLIAGVTMNVLFAWLLFVVVFMVGIPTPVDEQEASVGAPLVVTSVLPGSPAEVAGLTPGVEIVSATRGDTTLTTVTPSAFSAFTQESTEALTITYRADDAEKVVTIAPEAGVVVSNPDQPAVGISLAFIESVSLPFFEALKEATITTVSALGAIVVGLATLIAQSFTGTADFSQVAGPVGIVGLVGDAAEFGVTALLMFTAVISLNLAVINMLPFPALDGGRLLIVGIEAVRRKAINPVWVGRLNFAGFALLIILMIAVTWNDIAKIL